MRNAYRIFVWKRIGKMSLGRQRSWEDSIRQILGKLVVRMGDER
jgi:hypothetical protein